MFNNQEWSKKAKVGLYCQLGGALDMANFSIKSAINNAGLPKEEIELIFVTWKSKPYVYEWLKVNNFKYYEMPYDEGKGFLWNLYKGWNAGYEQLFPHVPLVCPIATDHYFYNNWLKNLVKNCKDNRIVNCKLVEPGILETLHTSKNYGVTVEGQFRKEEFDTWAEKFVQDHKDKLVFDDCIPNDKGGKYGHRLDAMPFVVPLDVWKKFGPMLQTLDQFGITGDTNFFNRCKAGGVEITKALDAISYHSGGAETARNRAEGIYT